LLQTTRSVTDHVANNYLQSILQKIIAVNPGLKEKEIRLVFSRDWWPNAYSMGEGTLTVNAGLMMFLDNEAELVFVICHELAHYYLEHSNKSIRKNVETYNSAAFQEELKRLSKQEYGVNKQLDAMLKKFAFGSRQHSRENESEADIQAFRL
jgi:predicted Zn-dependent protease